MLVLLLNIQYEIKVLNSWYTLSIQIKTNHIIFNIIDATLMLQSETSVSTGPANLYNSYSIR